MKGFIQKTGLDREDTRYRIALVLAPVLPVVILLSLFIVNGIYPFGDRSFLFSDMYHQYMPFFSEFLRKVKEGEGLAYSYNVGIGSNFLALYVYYLASPLHFLAFLVPESHLMEFMSYLVVIKAGLSGWSFFKYLKEHFQCKDGAMLFFSCFYALSGFFAAYNWNIMWLDCVILAPLILLGLERLVKEGRCGLYCVALAISIYTNYYISIMVCIFVVLYFVVLLITEKRSFRIIGNFVLYSVLAGGMASVLLVPEVCAILQTNFGDPDFPTQLKSYFSVLDELARHCMCVTTERGLEHWPNLYCGVAVFLLLPVYALNQAIPMKKRFANLALAGFMLLSFSTNVLDFAWHGLNYPDSLPARQSFLYIWLVLVLCYEAYRNISQIDKKQILYGYLAAVFFLLCCEKFIDSEDFTMGVEMLTLGFVTVYAVFLYLYRTREGAKWRMGLGLITLVAVIAESSVNMANTSIGTTSRSAYLGEQQDYKALYQWTKEQEDGGDFYRMEKFTRKTKNDGTLAGYPTASVFSSTLNSSVMELYEKLGMRHSKVYYGFDGATAFTSALLNVRYMFGSSDKYANTLYRQVEKSGEVYLYRAVETLPFGYVAPTGFDLPENYMGNGLEIQNKLVESLGVDGTLFERVTAEKSGDDVKFEAPETGIYYGYVTASGTKKIEVIGGSLETETYSDLKKDAVLYLGNLMEGEHLTLGNGDEEDDTPAISVNVYKMDEGVLREALDKLSANHLTQVKYDSTHVEGSISMEQAGRLILSIPYEKGWKVEINGERLHPELFGNALMAFDLEPGDYTLSMTYTPYGQYVGMVVSIVSILIFTVLMLRKQAKARSAGS